MSKVTTFESYLAQARAGDARLPAPWQLDDNGSLLHPPVELEKCQLGPFRVRFESRLSNAILHTHLYIQPGSDDTPVDENGHCHPNVAGDEGYACYGVGSDWKPTFATLATEQDWPGVLFAIHTFLSEWGGPDRSYTSPYEIVGRALYCDRCGAPYSVDDAGCPECATVHRHTPQTYEARIDRAYRDSVCIECGARASMMYRYTGLCEACHRRCRYCGIRQSEAPWTAGAPYEQRMCASCLSAGVEADSRRVIDVCVDCNDSYERYEDNAIDLATGLCGVCSRPDEPELYCVACDRALPSEEVYYDGDEGPFCERHYDEARESDG